MSRTASLFLLCGLLACSQGEPAQHEAPTPEAEVAAASVDDVLAPETGRAIVRTARLELRTDDVSEAATLLGPIATRFGGRIEESDGATTGDAFQRYQATLRVPSAAFEDTMAALREQGDVTAEHVESTDVTEKVTDLEAHLRSHRTLESRLLQLLERTESVDDALKVEAELVRVRSTIETLDGRRKTLASQVAMSRIDVALVQAGSTSSGAMARFEAATDDAQDLFVGVIAGMIRICGALLPLLLIGGPIVFAARRGLRRKKKAAA